MNKDSRKPCGGGNVNICIAEGCYGESCLTYNRQYAPDQFSGEDTPLFDFPVENRKRFSGRFSGLKVAAMAALYTFLGVWCLLLVAAVLGMIVALLAGYVMAWMGYFWWTLAGTVIVGLIYTYCYRAVKEGRFE